MRGLFICYRRDDTADITGRLYDRLVARYGRRRVFKDVFSIGLGQDFDKVITKALGQTDAVLVVMGERWKPERLAGERDPVRKEIELATTLGVRVIPLFVRGTRMPPEAELPESLRAFTRLNGMPVRDDPDFDNDVDRLCESVTRRRAAWWSSWKAVVTVATTALAATIAVGFSRGWFHSDPGRMDTGGALAVPDRLAEPIRASFTAPFCSVRTDATIAQCAFATLDACNWSARQFDAHCATRPESLYCDVDANAAPQDVVCVFRLEDCPKGRRCAPLKLNPVKQAMSPNLPMTDEEVAHAQLQFRESTCLVFWPYRQLMSCSSDTVAQCMQRRAFDMIADHYCQVRPATVFCVPSELSAGDRRLMNCHLDEQACRDHAMPDTTCRPIEIDPKPSVAGPGTPLALPAGVRRWEDMPTKVGPFLPFCPAAPVDQWQPAGADQAALAQMCATSREACEAHNSSDEVHVTCGPAPRLWCFLRSGAGRSNEPDLCSTSASRCESMRKAAIGKRRAVSDQCKVWPIAK